MHRCLDRVEKLLDLAFNKGVVSPKSKLLKGSQGHLQSTSSSRLNFTPDPSNVLTGGRSTHPDFWQAGVVLKPEALSKPEALKLPLCS